MKNWCKIIETDTHEILVRKSYNEDDDMYGVSVIFMVDDGVVITQTIGAKEEGARDRLFDQMPDEKYVSMVDDILNQLANL